MSMFCDSHTVIESQHTDLDVGGENQKGFAIHRALMLALSADDRKSR